MMFRERLYNVRDIEGNKNQEIAPLIKNLNEEFSHNPSHIGITLRGSKVKGYSTEASDIDVVVLFDSSRILDKNKRLYFIDALKEHKIAPMHMDINPEFIRKDFSLSVDSDGFGAVIGRIAVLTELTVGKRVKEYRDIFREEIGKLKDRDALRIKERTVNLLLDKENYSLKKIKKRVDTEIDFDEESSKRKALWEKRYDKIWNK